MNERKQIQSWVFACYIQSEGRFVSHSMNIPSFHNALLMHSQTFPSHSVVFCIRVPVYMATPLVKIFQDCLKDSKDILAKFQQLISTDNSLMPITPIKTYQGLVPLTYSMTENRLILSAWDGERYIDACAFILSSKLLMLFNEYLYSSSQNAILNLFSNGTQ